MLWYCFGGVVWLREVELRLIAELMKNSRRSDRELAKVVGASQPTVTRTRIRLEKEGFLKEYTVLPDFRKIGFELLALTFLKSRPGMGAEDVQKMRKTAMEATRKTAFDFVMAERGAGLGFDAVVVSLHRDYASYNEFRNHLRKYDFLDSHLESFLISLEDEVRYLPLTLTVLARHMLERAERTE
jgi:DNA-binding Lrp family transcriptional regulator